MKATGTLNVQLARNHSPYTLGDRENSQLGVGGGIYVSRCPTFTQCSLQRLRPNGHQSSISPRFRLGDPVARLHVLFLLGWVTSASCAQSIGGANGAAGWPGCASGEQASNSNRRQRLGLDSPSCVPGSLGLLRRVLDRGVLSSAFHGGATPPVCRTHPCDSST